MELELGQSKLRLGRDQLIALRDATGVRVTCTAGVLWITEEQSAADIVLESGQSHIIGQPGLTLVMALRAASLCVREPQASAWARLAGWVGRLLPTRLAARGIG